MSVLVDDLLLARFDADRPLSRGPVDMTTQAIDATSDAQVARRRPRRVLELRDAPPRTAPRSPCGSATPCPRTSRAPGPVPSPTALYHAYRDGCSR
jgi:hypothetical protein